jgi:hypothetical protein
VREVKDLNELFPNLMATGMDVLRRCHSALSRHPSSPTIKYWAYTSLSLTSSQTQSHIWKDLMDQPPRHPNDGLDDSPAARVKTRTNVRRRQDSTKYSEPRAATKRRYRKETMEARVGVQAGGHLGAPRPVLLFGPNVEADAETAPPQTPVFGFGSPQESWQGASKSPESIKSAKFRPLPASFYSSGIQVDGHGKPAGSRVYLGPTLVSPFRARNASKDLMDNPNPWGFGRQNPNSESRSDVTEPHIGSSASEAVPSGFVYGLHCMNEPTKGSMAQAPVNSRMYMNGISSGLLSRPSPSTDGSFKSTDPQPRSSINLPQTRNGSTGSLEMTSDGLETAPVTEWQPAGLLCMDSKEPESQYALLVLNQPIENLNMLRLIWKKGMFLFLPFASYH